MVELVFRARTVSFRETDIRTHRCTPPNFVIDGNRWIEKKNDILVPTPVFVISYIYIYNNNNSVTMNDKILQKIHRKLCACVQL